MRRVLYQAKTVFIGNFPQSFHVCRMTSEIDSDNGLRPRIYMGFHRHGIYVCRVLTDIGKDDIGT